MLRFAGTAAPPLTRGGRKPSAPQCCRRRRTLVARASGEKVPLEQLLEVAKRAAQAGRQ